MNKTIHPTEKGKRQFHYVLEEYGKIRQTLETINQKKTKSLTNALLMYANASNRWSNSWNAGILVNTHPINSPMQSSQHTSQLIDWAVDDRLSSTSDWHLPLSVKGVALHSRFHLPLKNKPLRMEFMQAAIRAPFLEQWSPSLQSLCVSIKQTNALCNRVTGAQCNTATNQTTPLSTGSDQSALQSGYQMAAYWMIMGHRQDMQEFSSSITYHRINKM